MILGLGRKRVENIKLVGEKSIASEKSPDLLQRGEILKKRKKIAKVPGKGTARVHAIRGGHRQHSVQVIKGAICLSFVMVCDTAKERKKDDHPTSEMKT